MDFTNRNSQQPQSAFPGPREPGSVTPTSKHQKQPANGHGWLTNKWARGAVSLLFLCVVALVVAVIILIAVGPNNEKEAQYVDGNKFQAVFLTNGQVYFGHVNKITPQYMNLKDIYYLQTSNNSADKNAQSNVTLVKLGCELHAPEDQMLIQTQQVSFWENLKDSGQVAKAIDKLGDKCTPSTPPASQNDNAGLPKNSNGSSNTTAPTNTNNSNTSNPTPTNP